MVYLAPLPASSQVRSCKPGDAISIIETDCQVDFEAPKDYKEPQYTPSAVSGPTATSQQPAAPPAGASKAAAAAEPEEPEEPKFVPFVGSGRRLDGRPSATGGSSNTPTSAAAAAAAARAAAAGGQSGAGSSNSSSDGSKAVGGSKPGTFVSTGNRLADKLAMDKVGCNGITESHAQLHFLGRLAHSMRLFGPTTCFKPLFL